MGEVRALNLWLSLSRCGDEAPGPGHRAAPPRRATWHARPTRRCSTIQVSQRDGEEAAGDTPILRPIFEPGDALLFDELFLHQTGSDPTMPNPRFAIENWFFGASAFPGGLRADRGLVTLDPYSHDPARWGASLAQSAELLLGCLDAAGARSVVEVGAFAGDLTRVLVGWAAEHGAQVTAVDPAPQPDLEALQGIELVRRTSLHALPDIPLPDAVIIDGDHNYFTVREELRLIGERAPGAALPLLLFHDVCWPHGRRDDYHDANSIPAEFRLPVADGKGGLFPGDAGLRPGALPYPRSAAQEGGSRNGVLTAVEDFVAERERLRLVVVPVFFGSARSGTSTRRGRTP